MKIILPKSTDNKITITFVLMILIESEMFCRINRILYITILS